jgi:hypothetical protein
MSIFLLHASGRNTQAGSSAGCKDDGLEAVGTNKNLELATSPHLSLGQLSLSLPFTTSLLSSLNQFYYSYHLQIHPSVVPRLVQLSIMPCSSHSN